MSSNWEHKLFNYKADPPPSAWDAIAAGLDAEKASFPEKLYNYAEQPPATAWQGIEAQLPAANGAKVVPLRTKMMRYAAAAVLLLAVVSVAYFTTISNSNQPTASTATIENTLLNTAPAASAGTKKITHYNLPPQQTTTQANDTPAEKEPQRSKSPQYVSAATSVRNLVARRTQVNLPVEPSFATELDVVPQETNIINTDRTDRYMIATSEEGEPVRLPKKVYSAFACPEDDPRHQACELRLAQLQQKMSASLTTDFVQFLDLLKNLQEN